MSDMSRRQFSRRQFLATSCVGSFLAGRARRSDAASPTLSFSTSPDDPGSSIIFEQDFDAVALGLYGADAIGAGWRGAKAVSGITEGRVTVFEGTGARAGRSIRVSYPLGGVASAPSGAQWMMSLGQRCDELSCAYDVRFAPDFDFVKGGKLPGLVGGGSNPSWAPAKDESAAFDRFVIGLGRV
jgi:hypothetical protein